MHVITAHKSDVGLKRRQNEDYVWVDEAAGLYILADGMGGLEAGDVASRLTATTVAELMMEQLDGQAEPLTAAQIKTMMTTAILTANDTVYNASQEAGHQRGMGSTIAVLLLRASTAYISHVGDSRVYLARNASLKQLTEDDTWGAHLAKTDPATNGQVQSFLSNVLTQAIGQDTTPKPSFAEIEVASDDWLILCSDGLWNMVQDDQTLVNIRNANNNPDKAVETLVAAANTAGGRDNISVIAIKLTGQSQTETTTTPHQKTTVPLSTQS